ncbi:hypothetical protein C8J56DRAFT_1014117 [Mycena floridula]|nr:hypothetical protein C8J56DRAFT_1014117 [Mycena floridula]
MIPLIPALALVFVSFLCSAFVILRIIIPILPPHPLSRRVSPAEFGLPNFRSLSLADKSHIWLHSLDILSLAVFVWQLFSESSGRPAFKDASDPASSVRLWIALTVRQTCLLVIAGLTLIHVRMARSVSFGSKHWMLWAPTLLLTVVSTALAGVLSGAGVSSLFTGLVAYTSSIAVMSSIALGCLIGTLVIIKRNLAADSDESEPWPPMEEKPRPSFATEDIEGMRDGASWITSVASDVASSRRNSASAWSFSTHHTVQPSQGRPQSGAHPSVPSKSTFWFNTSASAPPVPPLPSPYGPLSPTAQSLSDPDPFRRDAMSPVPDISHRPRERLGSQTSWLTSTNGSQVALSAWSYPTATGEHASVSNCSSPNLHAELLARSPTPAMADAQVLGGYGYNKDSERGISALAAPVGTTLDISGYRAIGWFFQIWVPLALAYPYLFSVMQNRDASQVSAILLILSMTMSAPILALNILFHSPIPIPSGLFDVRGDLPANLMRNPSPMGSGPTYKWSHEYKRSTSASVTVVEGRRSGDVWLSNGDAAEGKTKMSRAFSLVAPTPKLSVLPPPDDEDPVTPPLPMQDENSYSNLVNTPARSENSAQFGRIRNESKASSFNDDSLAFGSRIMVAQRHYSTLAQTVKVSTSPDKRASADANMMLNTAAATSVSRVRHSGGHLRTRSVSAVSGPQSISVNDSLDFSTPPSMPLPPTPPNVRAAKLAKHKKSYSSGFSFGPVDDMNEIDALTAGVLPLLVPGLKLGENMRIKGRLTPKEKKPLHEFGGDFSSPEIHSTPAARPRQPRGRKESRHKRNHWSLPSLSLGKEGVQHWGLEVGRAIENRVSQYIAVPSNVDLRRNTVIGAETANLHALKEEAEDKPRSAANLERAMSTRSLGLRPEVPHGVDTARSSIVTLNMLPPSATATLFDLEEISGPVAESTPHNSNNARRISGDIPPIPSNRRSSIVYIRSDDQEPQVTPPTSSTMASIAQWSSRAVRPLMTRTASKKSAKSASSKSPTGLRPLSLLQDRDPNVMPGTRPLQLAKKDRSPRQNDENVDPNPRVKTRGMKSLHLVRSETSKMRGMIRKEETLPDVVVRPPSNTVHQSYAYSFRE